MPEYQTSVDGTMFVALFLVPVLFGITLGQVCLYYSYFKQDTKYVRNTVKVILLLDLTHTATCARLLYEYSIISRIGDTSDNIDWSVGVSCLIGGAVATISQGFFTHRIWIFANRSYKAISIPLVLMIIRTGVGCYAVAMMFLCDTWSSYRGEQGAFIFVVISIAAMATNDAVVAISQVYSLRRIRSGSRGTDYIMRTIIAYAVNTSVLTMLVAIASLFAFVFDSNSLIFGGLFELECKLYANSLLATLNSRHSIRKNYPCTVELYPHAVNSMWFAAAPSKPMDNEEDGGEHMEEHPKRPRGASDSLGGMTRTTGDAAVLNA